MIVVAARLDFADQKTRDEVATVSAPIQKATRDDEPGCHAYCFAADPCEPNRIQVYELWEDEASLAAHFTHPNYLAMRDLLMGYKPTGSWNQMYLTVKNEPVYGPNNAIRSKFFVD